MIWDKAQELGRQIGQSTEYQALRRAESTLREDKDTVAKLDQIQTLARQVDQMVATGQMPDQATAESYETAVRDLEMSPVGQALRRGALELREAHGEGEPADQRGHGEGRDQQHHHAGMSGRGLFIVLEGPEGSGKSTLAAPLAERMRAQRRGPGRGARAGRHPGRRDRPAGAARSRAPGRPAGGAVSLPRRAGRAGGDGDRARAGGRAGGAVATGSRISTEAYQMAGRGCPADVVLPANRAAAGGLRPDLTLILDLPPEVGRARQVASGKRLDRLDAESLEFHRRVHRPLPGGAGRRCATFGWHVCRRTGSCRAGVWDGSGATAVLDPERSIAHRDDGVTGLDLSGGRHSAGPEAGMKQRWGLIVLVAAISFMSGGWLLQRGVASGGNVYQQARLFDDVLGHVNAYYVDSIGETDLYDRATRGMLEQLKDPYSVLLTGDDYKALTEQTSGNYAGLGIQIDVRDGWITVVAPLPETPAERAGVADRRPDHRGGRQVDRRLEERRGGEGAPRRGRLQGHDHGAPLRRVRSHQVQRWSAPRSTSARSRPARMFDGGVGYISLNPVAETSAEELQSRDRRDEVARG